MSFIFSGMIYLLVCCFKKPLVNLHSKLVKGNTYGDFTETHSLFLDFACNFIVPALVAFFIKSSPTVVIIGCISLIQTFMIYCALFLGRGSETNSKLYINIMPEATYFAGHLSMSLGPVIIIAFNIYAAVTSAKNNDDAHVVPFCVFSSIN